MTDPEWATWTDEQLLATRLCDLKVSIAGTEVEQYIAQVNGELEARGLVRPHYWLSDEWFTPDGVPGVAVPHYLAHPRLAKLELAQMLEVEGGDRESCLRDSAARGGTRHRQRVPDPAPPDAPAPVRHPGHAATRLLHAETAQELRAAPRSLGTRRAIPTRISRRPSRSGSIRRRCGRRAMPGGRRCASSNTWIG